MLCYLIGHRWLGHDGVEKKCKRCDKYKIFYGYAETEVYSESISKTKTDEIDYENEIKKQREGIKQFEKIVGSDPLEQIDWIIVHSLKSYTEWFYRCESGLQQYDSPLIVRENKTYRFVEEVSYVRGGKGNKLIGWEFSRVFKEVENEK